MKLTFNAETNVAYMQLREQAGDLETVKVTDELNVDLLPDGKVYGLEFLNAADQLGAKDGHLSLIDEIGKTRPLKVA